MRNPGTRALIWLALLAGGIFLLVLTFAADRRLDQSWTTYAMAIAGIMLIPFALVYSIWSLLLVLGRSRLSSGHRQLAEWHVSPDEWRRFCEFDRIRAGSGPGLGNDFNPNRQEASGGIDVRIGEKGLLVGDFYQVLRRGGLPGLRAVYWLPAPADPECLEFHILYPRKSGGGVPLCLRVPIARVAREDASRVYDHFEPLLRPRVPLVRRKPGLIISVSLAIALALCAPTAWAWSRAANGIQGNAELFALIMGAIVIPAALIMALATYLLSRRTS